MRVHIMSVGFTPEVFESLKAAVKTGVDRAIAIHSKRSVSKEVSEKVKATIGEIKKWVNTQEEFIVDESFEEAVRECIRILNSTNKNDELYVHIGGGERHIALALLYATFFTKRKMHLIVTTRIGEFKTVGEFKTEVLPPIPNPFSLSSAQMKVLKAVKMDRKLKEIVEELRGEKKDYPRVYRHLENLANMGLLSFNQDKKEYSTTFLGKLVLEGCK